MARTDLAAQKTAAEPMKNGETRTVNGVTVRCEGIAQGSTPKCVLYRLVLVGQSKPVGPTWTPDFMAAMDAQKAMMASIGYLAVSDAPEQAADGLTLLCKVLGQRNRVARRWF